MMRTWLGWFGFLRLSFGGDGGSSSSSSTTTTNTQNIDRRQVVDNGSIGTGDGATINYTRNDVSGDAVKWSIAANNEATWRAAALANEATARAAALSNESSARNAAVVNEAGAREAALLNETSARVFAYANESGARDAALANETSARSVDLAKTSTETGYKTLQAALGFATDALSRTTESTKGTFEIVDKTAAALSTAYANVADVSSGNKQLVTAGMIVAGIVAILAFAVMRKGAA